ncbi:MAG: D-alanyl-D-alanine carboxypeptidase [Patiriisocius sp.]|jgi:D-alanyl-D-alanine carboxypeptidase
MDKRLGQLGILQSHIDACRIPREEEAIVLVNGGVDVFDRQISMTPETFSAWVIMRKQAANDSIELQIVSAYRSIDYQCELFLKKLSRGVLLDEILKVNAIPGFSQHHTGRALDLTTLDYPHLEIDFELSPAFDWLQNNAGHFGFELSYPAENDLGIDYEPWHWAYIESE